MQSQQTVTGVNSPRIYCVTAKSVARRNDWNALLPRLVAMQFNAILVTTPTELTLSGQSSDISSVAIDDHDNDLAIATFSQACIANGLRLMLDLEIDRFIPEHPFIAQHPDNFYLADRHQQALPDPRFPRNEPHDRRAQLRLDKDGIDVALDYWNTRLATWLKAGVAGFRCLGIDRISPAFWQGLIAQARSHNDADFFAWTPGCTPEQLAAIGDCGFDAVFSSDAWWDYRAGWFAEERQRLAQIAAVIAAPEDPAGSRLIRSLHVEHAANASRAYRRAIQAAAALADGVMITQGFEFGTGTLLSELHRDARWAEQPTFDLSADIAEANRRLGANANNEITLSPSSPHAMQVVSAPDTEIAVVLRRTNTSSNSATLTLINADLNRSHIISWQRIHERAPGWTFTLPDGGEQSDMRDAGALTLQPGEVRFYAASETKPVILPVVGGKPAVVRASRIARIAIEGITPTAEAGRFPVKKIVGSVIDIEADIFSDGHDHLAASVLWRAADEKEWHQVPMQELDNDRWRAALPLQRIGRHIFVIEAWRDNFGTYRDELDKKTRAGIDVTLEIQEGRQLIEKVMAGQADDSAHTDALKKLLKQLPAKSRKKSGAAVADANIEAIALLLSSETAVLMRNADLRDFSTRSSIEYRIDVERKAAEFSNWYELFPRSQSGDVHRHGTFDDVIARLPAVRDMGFDTLYFPPIHPIGRKNMKGKNNSLTPGPDDPGSPYAIGSEAGGHDAVHPELGTLDDFRRMLAAAKAHGLEIALDFAIQCSPDHPWLKDHPEWFAWRPDGSIRYAENPPKKYEDIVNVDFYAESEKGSAIPDLWIALRDVVLMWVREGVRVFRVDNPHTKPLPFWEWMIGDVRSRAPDTIFLAEAFTRPKPMYRLAKAGFSQSYTYFTWRHTKQEFTDYLTELTTDTPKNGPCEFFRPHFFVNTPDINPVFLQRSGRPGFLIRAALAATLSGLWGVYSGFELCEAQAVTGKEEYLDSEKYEIRAWDWQRPGNIVHEVTQLNRIRNRNPALQSHLGVRFHYSSSDQILYFSKSTRREYGPQDAERSDIEDRFGDNVILVAINLDPFAAHDAMIELPLWQLGLPDHAALDVEELMSESRFTWHGKQQNIRLDPQQMPFAIWRVRSGTH